MPIDSKSVGYEVVATPSQIGNQPSEFADEIQIAPLYVETENSPSPKSQKNMSSIPTSNFATFQKVEIKSYPQTVYVNLHVSCILRSKE